MAELGGVSVATLRRWYRVLRRTLAFWPDEALGQQHYDITVLPQLSDRGAVANCRIPGGRSG